MLAIASGGGHWVQLLRLAPAFDGCDLHYATSLQGAAQEAHGVAMERGQPRPRLHAFRNANIRTPLRLVLQLFEVVRIVREVRPEVIVSTGASAGYFALRLGRMMGARTLWLDSVANAERLSLSGRRVGRHADLFLTQWPHLAQAGGPGFCGSVLPLSREEQGHVARLPAGASAAPREARPAQGFSFR